MKKIILIIFLSIILTLTGCSSKEKLDIGDISNIKLNNNDILVTVKEGTLSSTQATFIIENKSTRVLGYSEDYHLEKKINDSWYILNTKTDAVFKVPFWSLEPNDKIELKVYWEHLYGSLKPGEYRFIKRVSFKDETSNSFHIGVNFIIEES